MGVLNTNFKIMESELLIDSIESGNTNLYVFASGAELYNNESIIENANASYYETQFKPLHQIMFGKKIANTNIKALIVNNIWSGNTVYKEYNPDDYELFKSPYFFVTTDDSGTKRIYKCLFNNLGANSTVEPSGTSISRFQTSDGYIWKYMYSISSSQYNKFGSDYFVPVIPDINVTNAANTALEIIDVISNGNGYFTVAEGFIQSIQNTSTIQIQVSNTSHLVPNFFNDCAFYIDSGPGAGFYSKITSSFSILNNLFVTTQDATANVVSQISSYKICPFVTINGNGRNAKAIVSVNTFNYSIDSVSVINGGNGYNYATASISSPIGQGASLKAYAPPIGGHGRNPSRELGSQYLGIQTDFYSADNLPKNLTYRSVGILKNPISNTGSYYTANTFSQLFVCNTSPIGNSYIFTVGETIIGSSNTNSPSSNGATAVVVSSNNTSLIFVGDMNFVTNQEIIGQTSNIVTSINAISNVGYLSIQTPDDKYGNEVVYINNILPTYRSNTSNEVVKLSIQL